MVLRARGAEPGGDTAARPVRRPRLAQLLPPRAKPREAERPEPREAEGGWQILGHLLTLLLLLAVLEDLWGRGVFSRNNGRVVSFTDSLDSCYKFRLLRPWLIKRGSHSTDEPPSPTRPASPGHYWLVAACARARWRRAAEIMLTAAMLKYGGSSLVSLLIHETPVILKGPRHLVSFFLCFGLMHLVPRDSVFRYMHGSKPCQLCLAIACSVYKLRKLNFVAWVWQSAGWAELAAELLTLVLVLESNGMCRKVEEHRAAGKLSLLLAYTSKPVQCAHRLAQSFWPAVLASAAILCAQQMEAREVGQGWVNGWQLLGLVLVLVKYLKPFGRALWAQQEGLWSRVPSVLTVNGF